ncbi:HNH endonuclease [Agrobacterium rubi]|nr:HNH endonuclease [Agrobacterium rubi]NTF23751.1 HNH endonuclease [Agrobacterium rubi]
MACPRAKGILPGPKTDFLDWWERDVIRKAVFERDIPFCVWCVEEVGDHQSGSYYTVDHVETRSQGGAYVPDNLVLACKRCNIERGNMSVLQYMMARSERLSRVSEGFKQQSC